MKDLDQIPVDQIFLDTLALEQLGLSGSTEIPRSYETAPPGLSASTGIWAEWLYRDSLLIRNSAPLGTYRSNKPMDLCRPCGEGLSL